MNRAHGFLLWLTTLLHRRTTARTSLFRILIQQFWTVWKFRTLIDGGGEREVLVVKIQ